MVRRRSDWLRRLLMLLAFTAPVFPVVAQTQWRVERVFDGDSLRLYAGAGERLTVRLAGIDAPERAQPFADRSRQSLKELLADCQPQLELRKRDRYGRSVALVTCDDRDVGLAQVQRGWAWHFRRYKHEQAATERLAYARAEDSAREAGRGLWRDSAPTPPWIYRGGVR